MGWFLKMDSVFGGKGFSRRELLKGLLLGAAQFLPASALSLETTGLVSTNYPGERLNYQVGFLWFSDAGSVRISLRREENSLVYTGTIETEAKGFIARLAGNPKFFYQSRMELVSEKKRFRCLEYMEKQESGGVGRHLKETLDYQKGLRVRTWGKSGQPAKSREFPISPGTFLDDFLTAFYNFRLQAYGQVRKGAQFEVDTMAKTGTSKIHIKVADEDGEKSDELIVLVTSEQSMFGSKKGKIKMAIARDLVPRTVAVVSVLGLGDAVGKLTKREGSNAPLP